MGLTEAASTAAAEICSYFETGEASPARLFAAQIRRCPLTGGCPLRGYWRCQYAATPSRILSVRQIAGMAYKLGGLRIFLSDVLKAWI